MNGRIESNTLKSLKYFFSFQNFCAHNISIYVKKCIWKSGWLAEIDNRLSFWAIFHFFIAHCHFYSNLIRSAQSKIVSTIRLKSSKMNGFPSYILWNEKLPIEKREIVLVYVFQIFNAPHSHIHAQSFNTYIQTYRRTLYGYSFIYFIMPFTVFSLSFGPIRTIEIYESHYIFHAHSPFYLLSFGHYYKRYCCIRQKYSPPVRACGCVCL